MSEQLPPKKEGTCRAILTSAKQALLDLVVPFDKSQLRASSYAEPLSSSEIVRARNIIKESQAKLALLDQSRTLRRLEVLSTIHDNLCLLSPWGRMPAELLEIIFLMTKRDGPPGCFLELPKVSQVCRRWRDISLNFAPLWSDVSLDLNSHPYPSRLLKFVEFQLQKSRQHPLRVFIRTTQKVHLKDKAFTLLLDHSNRWAHAILSMNQTTIVGYSRVFSTLKKLQTLDLQYRDGNNSQVSCDGLFQDAPLRHISLQGNWNLENAIIPWKQILTYHGAKIPNSRFHPLQNLTSVTDLDVTWKNYTEYAPHDKLTMATLERLTVRFPNPSTEAYMSFFCHVILPNLKRLAIDVGSNATLQLALVRLMISSSSTPSTNVLEEFSCYGGIPDSHNELPILLRLVPNLKTLDIQLPPITDLRQFLLQANRRPLVPKLHTFHIIANHSIKDYKDIIHELVRNRCEWKDQMRPFSSDGKKYSRVARLKNFTIEFTEKVTRTELERDYLDDGSIFLSPERLEEIDQEWRTLVRWKEDLSTKILADLLQRGYTNTDGSLVNVPLVDEATLLQDLEDTFDKIEAFELTDARPLHASGLHLFLYDFQSSDYSRILHSQWVKDFQRRAQGVVDKWIPLLDQNHPGRRWLVRYRQLEYSSEQAASFT